VIKTIRFFLVNHVKSTSPTINFLFKKCKLAQFKQYRKRLTNKCQRQLNVNKMRNINMLKAYAVAMVLATAPVAVKAEQGVHAPAQEKVNATKTVSTSKSATRAGTVRF
jgi:hypothetical protein